MVSPDGIYEKGGIRIGDGADDKDGEGTQKPK